jgi:hypothetical protein
MRVISREPGSFIHEPPTSVCKRGTNLSIMHAYQDLCMQLCILSSLFHFKVFYLKIMLNPCVLVSVHTSLLTFLNLPPAKSRIVVVFYVVASRMITNLVEIMYNI